MCWDQKTNTSRSSTRRPRHRPVVVAVRVRMHPRMHRRQIPPKPSLEAFRFHWPTWVFPVLPKFAICGRTKTWALSLARSRRTSTHTAVAFTACKQTIDPQLCYILFRIQVNFHKNNEHERNEHC